MTRWQMNERGEPTTDVVVQSWLDVPDSIAGHAMLHKAPGISWHARLGIYVIVLGELLGDVRRANVLARQLVGVNDELDTERASHEQTREMLALVRGHRDVATLVAEAARELADAVELDGGGVDERTGKALADVRDALGRLDILELI